jgi:hypothetical protein
MKYFCEDCYFRTNLYFHIKNHFQTKKHKQSSKISGEEFEKNKQLMNNY